MIMKMKIPSMKIETPNKIPLPPTDMCIITTYRCPMQCSMCNIWEHPTNRSEEITPDEIRRLPNVKFINLTGGEPFIREDLEEIVEICFTKAPRVVISTSGWFEERVIALASRFPNIGIRISMEGLQAKNDALRGREGAFEKGMRILRRLQEMGIRDIGVGCTISNHNSGDMLSLYELAKNMKLEFATAAFHNSFYFHKSDNEIRNRDVVTADFVRLIESQLRESHPKSWFRAYFNRGLINYIAGNPRLLPCEAGSVNFFVDPWGEIYPCNGMEKNIWMESMGNIRENSDFYSLWESEQACRVREMVRHCPKNCWMVGTAAPVMKKYLLHTLGWVIKNKMRTLTGRDVVLDLKSIDK